MRGVPVDPFGLRIEDTPRGCRVVLPRRNLPAARGVAWAMVAVSGVIVAVATLIAVRSFRPGSGVFGAVTAVFPLVFAAAGLLPALAGLALLCGRNVVRVRHGVVSGGDYVGPLLLWPRRLPAERVTRVSVVSASASMQRRTPAKWLRDIAERGALMAIDDHAPNADDKRKQQNALASRALLAWGYPREVLEEVAAAITPAIDAARGAADPSLAPVNLTQEVRDSVSDAIGIDLGDRDTFPAATPASAVPDQPAKSNAAVDETREGLTVTLPPRGFMKGSKGLGCFSIAWCGFMAVFTGVMVLGGPPGVWFVYLFLAGFWAVGIAVFLGALNMGRRRTIIDLVGAPPATTVVVTRQGLFGLKQVEHAYDTLVNVRVGPSGMEVNDRPVMQLQFMHDHAGKDTHGLLSERDDDELEWLAALLRNRLRLPRDDAGQSNA